MNIHGLITRGTMTARSIRWKTSKETDVHAKTGIPSPPTWLYRRVGDFDLQEIYRTPENQEPNFPPFRNMKTAHKIVVVCSTITMMWKLNFFLPRLTGMKSFHCHFRPGLFRRLNNKFVKEEIWKLVNKLQNNSTMEQLDLGVMWLTEEAEDKEFRYSVRERLVSLPPSFSIITYEGQPLRTMAYRPEENPGPESIKSSSSSE
jgi:hypothetical protein